MARANYAAPGVYVEEVPSARQPIAGVGTNTVGFIGIVPDKIYMPMANPKYDPVKGAASATKRAADAADKLKNAGKADLQALEAALTKADNELKKRETEQKAAKKALENIAPGANQAAEATALKEADDALSKAKEEREAADLQVKQKKAQNDAAAAQSEIEDTLYSESAAPSKEDLIDTYNDANPLPPDRPYLFKEVTVRAAPFDTKLCTNFTEYADRFGDFSGFTTDPATSDKGAMWRYRPISPGHHMLTHAVSGFFKNGGTRCFVARVEKAADLEKALKRFESIDEVAIVAAPGLPKTKAVWEDLQAYCEHEDRQNVFAILDSPGIVGSGSELANQQLTYDDPKISALPRPSNHAAFYFPYIEVNDPAKRLQDDDPARGIEAKYRGLTYVAPSGHMAGVYARIDEERGVHKAPANAVLRGALEVKYYVSKGLQAGLNPQGVNCLRIMGGAVVAWGARTIGGDRNGEWKYINVRRFAGFLEESIDEGTQWVVFEPNDPTLWSKIRLNITAFLTNVWRNGALFGQTAEEAFYVKCDAELNPPAVRDLGQVITEIGVAIVRPAEFVIFRISQSNGAQKS
jgi:phage tail sheath protein FI